MKKIHLISVAAAALLVCSCVPSVNPFFNASDAVFDPRLIGEWQEKDKAEEPQIWQFEQSGDKAYTLSITEKGGKHGKFDANLFKLKQDYFLDLRATDCQYAPDQADLVGYSMFPGHLLARISQFEPGLKLAFFDFDWLGKYLDEHPDALAHHKEEKSVVLTASTADLQRFVLKHFNEGELFDKPGELVRKTKPKA